jgi:hypothetical protein
MNVKPTVGHLGMNVTYERWKLFTAWRGMKEEIENYVKYVR